MISFILQGSVWLPWPTQQTQMEGQGEWQTEQTRRDHPGLVTPWEDSLLRFITADVRAESAKGKGLRGGVRGDGARVQGPVALEPARTVMARGRCRPLGSA